MTRAWERRDYRNSMTSSNSNRAQEYLRSIGAGESIEKVFEFYSPEVVIQRFPNRIAPQGRVPRAADLRAAYELGRKICNRKRTECRGFSRLEMKWRWSWRWSGILAVPAMGLAAGSEMKAFVAMFLTFREGKIVSQRNYACYPPFAAELETKGRA